MDAITTARPLFPPAALKSKDHRHRLARFEAWLRTAGHPWHDPDLAAYRDSMLAANYARSSVSSHLSTIRAAYRAIVRDRARFYELVPREAAGSIADQKSFVDEAIARLENAITPEAAPVKTITRQDRPDSDHLRLTAAQAEALLRQPDPGTVKGLRDLALIGLLLTTGIREAEASALDVADLRQQLGGELALHVREGKGAKERLIPYGDLQWILVIVDRWLELAQVEAGPVLRSLRKGDRITGRRLSVRGIQDILKGYPLVIDGQQRHVRPHDLRRTYARRYYEAGGGMEELRQNLGHATLKTTQGYIGTLDADRRRPPALYRYDLSRLKPFN